MIKVDIAVSDHTYLSVQVLITILEGIQKFPSVPEHLNFNLWPDR